VLGEILVGSQYLPATDLEIALASQPDGVRLGEHLVRLGKLSESDLYECLSLQQKVSFQKLEPAEISRSITRALPAQVARKWKVLGYKVVSGQLFVAGPDAPSQQMNEDLRKFSSLEIRFHLVTPANFQELVQEFMPPAKAAAASSGG
jgi:type IV pilus assembly protein PilB